MDLWPSQVRKIILDGHKTLRNHMSQLEQRGEDLARSKKSSEQEKFIELFADFTKMFLEHIQTEETILKPALTDADAWGAVRVARMQEEHMEQRGKIMLLSQSGNGDFDTFLENALDFIKEIYVDMQEEEEELLSDKVLRDDVISISGCSE